MSGPATNMRRLSPVRHSRAPSLAGSVTCASWRGCRGPARWSRVAAPRSRFSPLVVAVVDLAFGPVVWML